MLIKKPKESEIQKDILKLLVKKNIVCWPNKTQGTYDPRKGVFRRNTTVKGVPDILGSLPSINGLPGGRLLAIEVKLPGCKLSEDQRLFLIMLEKTGALAFKAESIEDVEKALEDYF